MEHSSFSQEMSPGRGNHVECHRQGQVFLVPIPAVNTTYIMKNLLLLAACLLICTSPKNLHFIKKEKHACHSHYLLQCVLGLFQQMIVDNRNQVMFCNTDQKALTCMDRKSYSQTDQVFTTMRPEPHTTVGKGRVSHASRWENAHRICSHL